MSLHLLYSNENPNSLSYLYTVLDDVTNEEIVLGEKDIIDIFRGKGTVYNAEWSAPNTISVKGILNQRGYRGLLAIGCDANFVKVYCIHDGVRYVERKYLNYERILKQLVNIQYVTNKDALRDKYNRALPYVDDYGIKMSDKAKNLNVKLNLVGETDYEFNHEAALIITNSHKYLELRIPEFTEVLLSGQFKECEYLKAIELNEGLKVIGPEAFKSCTSLSDIKLPSTLVEIGKSAFEGCYNIKKIEVPSGVKELSNACFKGMEALREVTLNTGLERIGDNVFRNCTELRELIIPPTVKNIGHTAFIGCKYLNKVIAPIELKEQIIPATNIKLTDMAYKAYTGHSAISKAIVLPIALKKQLITDTTIQLYN